MLPARLLPASAIILGLLAPALAQQQPVLREADDDLVVAAFNRSVDEIEDADLLNAAGEEIGEVEEVLVDAGGRAVAIVADVGDFLGIGDKEVIIGLDLVELRGDDLVTTLTREELAGLPIWDD